MYSVQVMLSCTDMNVFTARNIALLPQKGQGIKCKVCGETVIILFVGKPYQVKEKRKTKNSA